MGSIKIKESPELRLMSKEDMTSVFGGKMFCDPLSELESLGGVDMDDEPEGGGSIRA